MSSIPKGQFHYEIELIGKTEYSLKLECNVEGLLNMVIAKARQLQSKKEALADMMVLEVQPEFYNLIKSILHRKITEIGQITAKDKIKLLNARIINAVFVRKKRSGDEWIFSTSIGGDCLDDRPGA